MRQAAKIFLASSSPRRRELLHASGLKFVVRSPDVDETPRRGETPVRLVKRLARAKAMAVADGLRDSSCVIAADTLVVAPDARRILGKPRSGAEALGMLKMLSGKTHTVWTGFAIVIGGICHVRAVKTRVEFRPLTDRERRDYVRSGEPMDKAGAYGAQGRGMTLIRSIRGSYTNVVGLPVAEVLDVLRRCGVCE